MRLGPKRLVTLGAMVFLAALVSTAYAHDLPQERTILVQVAEDRVEVMLVFLEPPGPRADLMFERFDLDRDGKLRGGEAKLAGGEWIRRALDGVQFEVAGEAPRAREPEIKFRREQRGSLSAAVYARWDLEPLEGDQTRTVHVRLLRQPKNVPTEVTFQAAQPLTIVDVDLPARFRGAPMRPVLTAGEQASAMLRRKTTQTTSRTP